MDKPKYTIQENKLTTAKFDLINTIDCGGECTMPDYYPQIRKIVSCTACALPDSKFISGNTLEFGGTVAFTVLYIGDDGALVSFPYATEYVGNEALPSDVQGTAEIAIDAKAEDVQCRVLAPRKLSLKGRIRSRISASDRTSCNIKMTGADGKEVSSSERAAIQSLSRSIPTLLEGRGMTTGKASDIFRERQGAKPISCNGTVNITEAKCKSNSIIVKGIICAKALVFSQDGSYSTARAHIPFEDIISADGAAEGDLARAWGRIASASVSESDNGEISAELEYDVEAQWCRKQSLSIMEDAYGINRESRCSYGNLSSFSPLCCANASISVNGNGKRTTKPSANEYLIDTTAEATVDRAEQKDERIVFTGSCRIKSYIASNGEVICEEMSLPVKYEVKAESPFCEGKIILFADVAVTDISGRLEGDSIHSGAELCLSIYAKRENKISPLSAIAVDKEDPERAQEAKIKVIYGEKDQRLWDISKKYKASIAKVEKANDMSRIESIEGKHVIIPIGIG